MTLVKHEDLKACRLCNKGARPWFESYGLNWRDFVHNGIPANVLLETGDGLAKRVVEAAMAREAADGLE